VLWKITEVLVRLVAPILSFTADEVWEYLPHIEGREISVHLALFPKPEDLYAEEPANLLAEWKQLFTVRDEAFRVLEDARQGKRIGKGLEADLEIAASGDLAGVARATPAALRVPERVGGSGQESREPNVVLEVAWFRRQASKCARAAGIFCRWCGTTASGRTSARAASRPCGR
jgi:isoleucyl-tRNA synthetase